MTYKQLKQWEALGDVARERNKSDAAKRKQTLEAKAAMFDEMRAALKIAQAQLAVLNDSIFDAGKDRINAALAKCRAITFLNQS